jgi:hypothetical protein
MSRPGEKNDQIQHDEYDPYQPSEDPEAEVRPAKACWQRDGAPHHQANGAVLHAAE